MGSSYRNFGIDKVLIILGCGLLLFAFAQFQSRRVAPQSSLPMQQVSAAQDSLLREPLSEESVMQTPKLQVPVGKMPPPPTIATPVQATPGLDSPPINPPEAAAEAVVAPTPTEIKQQFLSAERVVFLGDSNTHAGEFITLIEATLLDKYDAVPEIINLGLPSETVCGLSEPEHPFPRPNLQERLVRVLQKTQPDIIVACYGMNDGIYAPFDEQRYKVFRSGIRDLILKANKANVKLVLLTPPPFDRQPFEKQKRLLPLEANKFSWKSVYENYDDVMKTYADFVMTRQTNAWVCIDIYDPIKQVLAEKRQTDANFSCSSDGVHLDRTGHQVLAETILNGLGFDDVLTTNEPLLRLVRQRQQIASPAWLSNIGHLRPDMKSGLPMPEADVRIKAITKQINDLLLQETAVK